ncbi:hypothetical protein, partial [Acidiphilium sp.]|uniref:hypothetical protein n=1 Tax=Acidiphilium sp. TaxID=527 RepID=UPI003D05F761
LIEDIEAICAQNKDEGFNVACDILAELGLYALTDQALETLAERCRYEFGSGGMMAVPSVLQMSLDL